MFKLGAVVDKMMGSEKEPCVLDDRRALALLGAGLDTGPLSPDIKLSNLGSPQELQAKLGNVSHLYISGSLAEDVINDATVGDVIAHLDAAKLSFVIEKLRKEERQTVSVLMHDNLDTLKNNIV